jgi:hypothetical protein
MKTKATKPAATNGHAKKTPLNQPLPEGHVGVKEVAKQLKLEPRHLRVILRSMGLGTGGERYSWPEADLPKMIEAVKAHQAKADEKK